MNINYFNINIPTRIIKIIYVKAKRFHGLINFGIAYLTNNSKILDT